MSLPLPNPRAEAPTAPLHYPPHNYRHPGALRPAAHTGAQYPAGAPKAPDFVLTTSRGDRAVRSRSRQVSGPLPLHQHVPHQQGDHNQHRGQRPRRLEMFDPHPTPTAPLLPAGPGSTTGVLPGMATGGAGPVAADRLNGGVNTSTVRRSGRDVGAYTMP